jgi:hypothetical protein
MWQVGWIGMAIFAVFAVIEAGIFVPKMRRLGKIFGAAPSGLDTLRPDELVVVHGRVAADLAPLLVAPFTGRAAARLLLDLGERDSRRKVARVPELSARLAVPFALVDELGHRVRIPATDPEQLELPTLASATGAASSEAARAFLESQGKSARKNLHRPTYMERGLFEGEEVWAMGIVRPGPVPELGAPAGGRLILTSESPESYRELARALRWTTIVFAAICGILVLIGLVGASLE